MNKKVSLRDIATRVGVSTALVSYVLNNKKEGRIGKEISAKIREVAAKLNYRPNLAARSLRTNRTNTIGLIVSDISNPFSSSLARMIENEAIKYNYTVIFGSSDENSERMHNLVNVLQERQVDGFIIAPVDEAETQIHTLKKNGIPLVLIDRYFPAVNTDHVVIDNFKAAYDATSHLVRKQRRNIAMIGFKTNLMNLLERKLGYKAALRDNGINGMSAWIKEVRMHSLQPDVEKSIDELLSLNEPIDAILFASNNISTFALKHLNKLDVKIPAQVALAAIDETDASELFYAPLTCMRQPIATMAQLAVQILMDQLNSPGDKKRKTVHHKLEAELVVRKSSDTDA